MTKIVGATMSSWFLSFIEEMILLDIIELYH